MNRNKERFPADFMLELTQPEYSFLRSQIVILENDNNSKKGRHSKYAAYAFTEQGVAMLSSVLNSKMAIDVNIAIIRAFVLLRQHLADYKDLKEEIKKLEKEMNLKFKDIYEAINYLLNPKSKPVKIGFRQKGRTKIKN